MRRQIQLRGERDWAGDDLIDLQNEPIKALDAIFTPYPACVISGCEITANATRFNVSAGYVSIKGLNHDNVAVSMVVPFVGLTDTVLPIYLTLASQAVTDVYGDGAMKPIAYNYVAEATTIKPSAPHLEISMAAKVSFMDVVQSDARRWATKALLEKLDGIATGANKYIHPDDANTRHVTDTEKNTWNSKASTATATTTANGLMLASDKKKLDGVAANANNYAHPNDANTRHVTDTEKNTWNAKAGTDLATIVRNGLMSNIDKFQLMALGKNAYSSRAGRVAFVQNVGPLPEGMLTKLRGDFTVELLVDSNSGYMYKVTHNAAIKNLPHVNIEAGGLLLLQVPKLLAVEANYFIVGFDTHNMPNTTDTAFFPAPFNFTVEIFPS